MDNRELVIDGIVPAGNEGTFSTLEQYPLWVDRIRAVLSSLSLQEEVAGLSAWKARLITSENSPATVREIRLYPWEDSLGQERAYFIFNISNVSGQQAIDEVVFRRESVSAEGKPILVQADAYPITGKPKEKWMSIDVKNLGQVQRVHISFDESVNITHISGSMSGKRFSATPNNHGREIGDEISYRGETGITTALSDLKNALENRQVFHAEEQAYPFVFAPIPVIRQCLETRGTITTSVLRKMRTVT